MRNFAALLALAFLFAHSAARAHDDTVYRAGGGVSAPVLLEKTEPAYSEAARNDQIEGTVQLSIVIDEKGRVENVRIVRGLHPDLDKNAIESVKTWKFKPGEKDGNPVKVKAEVEINFRLN